MTEENNNAPECETKFVSYLKKINELRKDIAKCDWKDNKMCNLGKGSYSYISTDKIKAQMMPLFVRHGLHWHIRHSDVKLLEGAEGNTSHWLIQLKITLSDCDTGYSEEYDVFGEGVDFGDKGLAKAETYAIKSWLSDVGLIANGIDPDAVGKFTSDYRPKTPSENEEIMSKVASAPGIVQPSESEEPKQEPKPAMPKIAPKAVVPKAVVPKAAPQPEEPKQEPKAEQHAEEPPKADENPAAESVSVPQQKAIAGIVAKWTKAGEDGLLTAEQYNEMSMDKISIKTSADAMKFIAKYRNVPQ